MPPWNSDFWACSILRSRGSELKDLRGLKVLAKSVFASMQFENGARGLRELDFRMLHMLHACSIEKSTLHVLRDSSGTRLHVLREFCETSSLPQSAESSYGPTWPDGSRGLGTTPVDQ